MVSLLFGTVGVPATFYLAAWLAAIAVYLGFAEHVGTTLAFFAFLLILGALIVALESFYFLFL